MVTSLFYIFILIKEFVMNKLKLLLLILTPCIAFGISQKEMDNATCANWSSVPLHLNSKTTLQDIKDNCRISKQKMSSKGLFEVKIYNNTTNREIICTFPDNSPAAILIGCR